MVKLAALLAWLPAVSEVESHSCAVKVQDMDRPAEERSYGCHGVRLVAYEDARKVDPTLPPLVDPERIVARLRDDPQFNKRVAAAYMGWLRQRPGLTSECAVLLGYNAGPTGARRWMKKHGNPCESNYVRRLIAAKTPTKEQRR